MSITYRRAQGVLALSCLVMFAACGESDPQSPASTTSSAATISGIVVYEQTGSPAENVDVILESGTMMGGDHWNQTAHMMTNGHGQFHFEYMHEPMHRYRVGVRGRSDWHMCDWTASDEDGIVLVIPPQSP